MAATIQQALKHAIKQLNNRVDDPHVDAQTLLCHLLDVDRGWLIAHGNDKFDEIQSCKFNEFIQRRIKSEPVAYITGYKEFWSHNFKVTADTLIPRPETEHLVEQVLKLDLPHQGTSVLDFGTGSGAIAIALAKERPGWNITAMDISADALSVARENAQTCGAGNITFIKGNSLSDSGTQKFTAIVSNPPYIEVADPHLQQGDVRFEPMVALISGEDGLDCIRTLIKGSPDYLESRGHLIMEHGFEQGSMVRKLLKENNYMTIHTIRDLNGNERVTMAAWNAS